MSREDRLHLNSRLQYMIIDDMLHCVLEGVHRILQGSRRCHLSMCARILMHTSNNLLIIFV